MRADFTNIPDNFPVGREVGHGDGFDLDYVRHQSFQCVVPLGAAAVVLLPMVLPMIGCSLGRDERKVIGTDIATVEFGWPIGLPVCRPLGKGLYEVRSDLPGNRIARTLFTIRGGELVLLHGFIKKTKKTPKADLDLARSRKATLK